MSTSSPAPVPMVNGENFPKLFLTRSENEEDVAAFSVNPCIIALSINEPPIAGFSIEMSDSSDSSKRSKVPVEKAKTSPC